MPFNEHSVTILLPVYGDALVMEPSELALEEYTITDRWSGAVPEVEGLLVAGKLIEMEDGTLLTYEQYQELFLRTEQVVEEDNARDRFRYPHH
jgi:hypothetical protein